MFSLDASFVIGRNSICNNNTSEEASGYFGVSAEEGS